jgi:hypothetical protein
MTLSARDSADDPLPGSQPLKNGRHERLARERAAGMSMADAWRETHGREPANASRTFSRPDIQARVTFLREKFNDLAGLSLAALQARLLRIADSNVVDFFEMKDNKLRLRDLTTLPSTATGSISELAVDKDGAIKLKTADKLHAIDSLIKTVMPQNPDEPGKGMTLEELVVGSMQSRGGAKMSLQVETGVPRSPDVAPREEAPASRSPESSSHGSTRPNMRRVRL